MLTLMLSHNEFAALNLAELATESTEDTEIKFTAKLVMVFQK
jgi:hypothetical protein